MAGRAINERAADWGRSQGLPGGLALRHGH